jgi:lipid-A-disaccharide synthase
MKIYIIAGEASGDIYGAKLIDALRKHSVMEFFGIGGEKMTAQGLTSLFPMSELSIMGFLEVIPHIPNTLNRIRQTVEHIKHIQPDIVITIDSPGFCCRVAESLRNSNYKRSEHDLGAANARNIKLLHYVAPTVWAYKPKRAQKFARLFDHLLVILPFEPPYFEAVGLPCTYIGHPITESTMPDEAAISAFKQKYNITAEDKVLCLMPGSRIGEVKRLLPIFLESVKLLPKIKLIIPTISATAPHVEQILNEHKVKAIILQNDSEKFAAYKSSTAALVKSGTGSLEVAMAGCPMVVAYKVNYLSYIALKLMVKIKYANLINIILNKELIPELLQHECAPNRIAEKLSEILSNPKIRQNQLSNSHSVLTQLGQNQTETPSEKAAKAVLALIEN